jgi:hypothetical protein
MNIIDFLDRHNGKIWNKTPKDKHYDINLCKIRAQLIIA